MTADFPEAVEFETGMTLLFFPRLDAIFWSAVVSKGMKAALTIAWGAVKGCSRAAGERRFFLGSGGSEWDGFLLDPGAIVRWANMAAQKRGRGRQKRRGEERRGTGDEVGHRCELSKTLQKPR